MDDIQAVLMTLGVTVAGVVIGLWLYNLITEALKKK